MKKVLMCYGKTLYTPGRYLEDGLRSIGIQVDVIENSIDFSHIAQNNYLGIIFVESPSQPIVEVKNIHLVKIPKLLWIHHGENRLMTNISLEKMYKPDLILMAHSLHLSYHFRAPTRFFPFAMASNVFNCSNGFDSRNIDISFVGSNNSKYYLKRTSAINRIKKTFQYNYSLSVEKKLYLNDLANEYCNSKIIINYSADKIKSLNMRIFEGMGCGSLVLTDYVPGLEKLFKDKVHYVIFNGEQDLIRKIHFYLRHKKLAETIAKAGHRHLLSHHTYEHRAKEIIILMKKLSKKRM